MNRKLMIIGAVLGALAVAIGAYGAHGGAKYITPESTITFGKAVRYQMYHVFAILIAAVASGLLPNQKKILSLAGYAFLLGIILFSGSLYVIVFAKIPMGYITPTGGTFFIIGWFLLAYAALKK